MNKHEVLSILNEMIKEEKGQKVSLADKFVDAQLDSLGTVVVLTSLDNKFNIFNGYIPDDEFVGSDPLMDLDIKNLTIRDLIIKCLLPPN